MVVDERGDYETENVRPPVVVLIFVEFAIGGKAGVTLDDLPRVMANDDGIVQALVPTDLGEELFGAQFLE